MKDFIKTIEVNDRKIVVEGIGKLFYQDGFPIPMAVNMLKEKGLEVSYLHLAKELLHEWTPKTVIKKLKGEFSDSIIGDEMVDMDKIEKFCNADWDDRREMIFQYLWGYSSESVIAEDNPMPNIEFNKIEKPH